jgi:hypothetical protein
VGQEVLNYWDVIDQIDKEIERIGWTTEKAKAYVKATYGKHSRHQLTDKQLLEFWDWLKAFP